MYVIRFTIRRKSNQRKIAKHAYLRQVRRDRAIVCNHIDGGSSPVTLDEASRFNSQYDATLALIDYFKQIGQWDRSMWVKNPVIIEVND